MKDYLAGDLELVQMNRGAGANDVGMVAWLMVLKTVEYPEVRMALYYHMSWGLFVSHYTRGLTWFCCVYREDKSFS